MTGTKMQDRLGSRVVGQHDGDVTRVDSPAHGSGVKHETDDDDDSDNDSTSSSTEDRSEWGWYDWCSLNELADGGAPFQ